MIHLKAPSHQMELKNSINRLVADLHRSILKNDDRLIDNDESIASYVARLNDQSLNRSFLDYCNAARTYAKKKSEDF